jgi:hypothetical protein
VVASGEEHRAGGTVRLKVSRLQAKLMPPDMTLGVVEVQLGGNDRLDGMEGVHGLKVEHTHGIQVRVTDHVEQGTLGHVEDRGKGGGSHDTVRKGKLGDGSVGVGGIVHLLEGGELMVGVPAGPSIHETAHHFLDKGGEPSLDAIFIHNVVDLARNRVIVATHGDAQVLGNQSMRRGRKLGPLGIKERLRSELSNM